MARRPHPNFEKENQWLQSFEGLEPSSFEDMLQVLNKLNGDYKATVDGEALSLQLSIWGGRAKIELFRQTKTEVLRASWLTSSLTESDLDSIRSRLEDLTEEIQAFNRQAEHEALTQFVREKPEITVYPADQDFFMAMPDPRAFFEAAELRANQIVIDTRSSLILEFGAEAVSKEQGSKRPLKIKTEQVIAAGRERRRW